MIRTFGNKLAEDLFNDSDSPATRKFPPELHRVAKRKLQYLNAANLLQDLAVPPGNRLHALKEDLKGYHAISINDQWRIIFRWGPGGPSDVEIVDYH